MVPNRLLVIQTSAIRNQRASETAHSIGLSSCSWCALLEEASGADNTVESAKRGEDGRSSGHELLVDLTTEEAHHVTHTGFDNLNDCLLALVLELFLLGDDDWSDEVRPLIEGWLHHVLDGQGDRLITGGELSDGGVLAYGEWTLDFNPAILIFYSAEPLGKVKERNSLEEFIDFAVADGEQSRGE